MKLMEIIRRLFSPKPIGTISFKGMEEKMQAKYIPGRFAIALLIIGGLEYFFYTLSEGGNLYFLVKANLILLVYILLAAIIRIKPNFDNLGWVPFMVNDPFRISDNFNRFLVFLLILMLPGKFLFHAISDFIQYAYKRKQS